MTRRGRVPIYFGFVTFCEKKIAKILTMRICWRDTIAWTVLESAPGDQQYIIWIGYYHRAMGTITKHNVELKRTMEWLISHEISNEHAGDIVQFFITNQLSKQQ